MAKFQKGLKQQEDEFDRIFGESGKDQEDPPKTEEGAAGATRKSLNADK